VDLQFVGDLSEHLGPLGHAVGQIRPEVGEAELPRALGQATVNVPAALTGAADLR
jgi:hypothetical protein